MAISIATPLAMWQWKLPHGSLYSKPCDNNYCFLIKNTLRNKYKITNLKEEDAQRPEEPKIRNRLKQQDPYGDAKFAGETVLEDQRLKGGFPWVAFRYADVIGPRDVTRKFYHIT